MKSKLMNFFLGVLAVGAFVSSGCSGDSGTDCPVGQSSCADKCVDTATDRDNCGACGNSCMAGQYCAAGQCVACQNECMMGEKQCAPGSTSQYQECGDPDGDTCLEWTPAISCGVDQVCQDGECVTACSDECTREDAKVCDTNGANGFRVCGNFDDDDCLEYGELNNCPTGQTCVEGACVESCVDECPAEGDRTCAAPPDNGFMVCGNFDGDSCLEWGGLTLCPQGETCSAGTCSSECTDDCTPNQKICEGNGYRQCGSYDADPCLDWSGVTNCAAYEICKDGACETACSDECDTGEKRCNEINGQVGWEVCGNFDNDPCLEFGSFTSCQGGYTCENGNCVENCTNDCDTAGAHVCDGNGYRTCGNYDADSCLEWSADITSCDDNQTCIGGQCSEVCVTQCNEGDRECSGGGWHECVAVADPQDPNADCWVWSDVTNCDAFYACDPASATCVLTCSDECPSGGAQQCTNDLSGYQVCAANWDADPCLEWGTPVNCQQYYACDPSTSQCVLDCTDDCLPTGSLRCTPDGSGTEECGEWDGDPCMEWNTDNPVACPDGEVCSNGVCAATCSDECDTNGTIVCSADDPTGKTYRICGEYDSDSCLDLSTPLACGYGEQCGDDGNGVTGCQVVCTDDCPALNDTQCNGNTVEVCAANFDSDECLEWGTQTTCSGATPVCYNASCFSDTAPSTVLINEVLYNNEGTDTQDGNFLFIELYGTAGQDLTGYSVVGVNGNSSASNPDYVVIPLDGYTMPSDGHFVIARPNGDAALVAEADLLTNDVDLQNGPDSVQVRWLGTQVVDALAYDTFSDTDNFAGEGADYTHAAPAADPSGGVMYCLSRDAAHDDTDDNAVDFYRRTLNNCSPGWEGPGLVVAQSYVYGGTSTPAMDSASYVWTIDSYGWVNVTKPGFAESDDDLPVSGVYAKSSVAMDLIADPNVAYVGTDNGVYGYTLNITADDPDPFTIDLNISVGPLAAGNTVQSTPAVSLTDGAVFFGTQGAGFFGFNSDGTQRFNYDTGGAWVDSSPSIGFTTASDEVVVFGVGGVGTGKVVALCTTATGSAPCVDAGDVLWESAATGGGCNSSPAIADGVVYIGCDDGILYAYNLDDGSTAPGFPIDISNGGATKDVDGCSPVAMPDGNGNTLIRMTSRSPDGDFYLLSYDGSSVTGAVGGFGMLMSSFGLGDDGSATLHAGAYILNYGMDGSLQWYASISTSQPDDAWIHSSPTWIASSQAGYGYILVVDPKDGNLITILATAGPAESAGSFPQFHADMFNTGVAY